jgi:hypothetical protein
MSEKIPEELPEDLDLQVEFTSDLEYIQAAYFAISAVDDMDTAIMSKTDELRVKRIKRKALVIIDECLKCLYDEIIEGDEE